MIDVALTQINPLEVASYLINTGWEAIKSRRPHINLFTIEREGETYEITLPLNRNFKDYSYAINNVAERIAEVEHLQLAEVVNRLITPAADVVKFRRSDIYTQNGTIPFNDGIRLFENAKKALYVVVCDLLEPKLYHKRLSLKAADAFIERCSFGQTERGSYVATIVCPFSQADKPDIANQLSLFNEIPDYSNSFTRQVTSKLMKSLSQVHTAIETKQLSSIQNIVNPADVISGNLLEALLELNGSDNNSAEIEISTQWAPSAPMKKDLVPTSVKFNQADFPPIEVEIERIQQTEVKSRPGVFIGRISLIQAEPNIEERTNGEAILNTLDQEGKLIKPKIVVSPQELELVMRAMKEGANVRVRGILSSRGRNKSLEYTTLELLD